MLTMTGTDGCMPTGSIDNSTLLSSSFCSNVIETEPAAFSSSGDSVDRVSRADLLVVENVVYVGIFPVLAIVGIITNVINIVIFARQGLADRINVCLFGLSLSDLGYVLFLMATTSHRLLSLLDRELGQHWKVQGLHTVVGVFRGFLATSNAITMIISLERCTCVLAPLHARKVLRARFMVVVIVAISVFVLGLYGLFNLKFVTVSRIDPSTNTTIYVPSLGNFYLQHRTIIDFIHNYVLSVTIPTTSLVVVIISTVITVVQLRASLAWRRETATTSVNDTRELALTKMLVAICCVYVVCNIPTVTKALLVELLTDFQPAGRYSNSFYVLNTITHLLGAISSSVNFFFYSALGSKYRSTLRTLCRHRKNKNLKVKRYVSDSGPVTAVNTVE